MAGYLLYAGLLASSAVSLLLCRGCNLQHVYTTAVLGHAYLLTRAGVIATESLAVGFMNRDMRYTTASFAAASLCILFAYGPQAVTEGWLLLLLGKVGLFYAAAIGLAPFVSPWHRTNVMARSKRPSGCPIHMLLHPHYDMYNVAA